jgi:hypothetical protein
VADLDAKALTAALDLFAKTFVVDDKRTQVAKRLATADRRVETLTTLPRWIKTRTAPLEGADKSPAGIRTRFGDLTGVLVAEDGAQRTTIAKAVELGKQRASLFVADSGNLALITSVDVAPLLCSRI